MVGSVFSEFNYSPIPRIDVLSDFEPASGSNIDDISQIKIWVKPIDQIEFSGVNFAYTENGKTVNTRSAYTVDQTATDEDGFTPIMTAIPANVRGKGQITVTLADLKANDGHDHATDVRAVFTSDKGVFNVTADNRGADGVCPSLKSFTADFKDGIKLATLSTPAVITLSNMNREVVASVEATAENVAVSGSKASFSLDKAIVEDGRYILMIPQGTFLLGSEETPNDAYYGTYEVEVQTYGLVGDIKVTPNPELKQEALTTVVMEWTSQAAVLPNFDITGSAVYDAEGNKVSDIDFAFGTNTKEVNVYITTPVRTSGVYTLKFPAAQFLYGHQSDIESEAIQFDYTVETAQEVENPWDTYTLDPEPTTELESLSTFLIQWPKCESAGIGGDWFGVQLPVRNQAGSETTSATVDYDYEIEDLNVVRVTLASEITTAGSYTIVFPAGMFTFNDVEENLNKQFSVTYTVKQTQSGDEYTFVPDPALHLAIFDEFAIFFNNHSVAGTNGIDGTVTDKNGENVAKAVLDYDFEDEALNKLLVKINPSLDAEGVYTVTLPAGAVTFDDDPDIINEEPIVVNYIIGKSGISLVIDDNTEVNVYDIEGRMVRTGKGAATLSGLNGVYVVNGIKTILK